VWRCAAPFLLLVVMVVVAGSVACERVMAGEPQLVPKEDQVGPAGAPAALEAALSVSLAERFSTLGKEALAFEVLVAFRALEALAVVVVVEGLHPSVSGLDRETAANTLCREEVVPVSLAVRQSVLQVECARPKDLPTVGTAEALRVELFTYGVQTIALDPLVALAADRGEVLLITVLTVECPLLLYEAHVDQWLLACVGGAHKVVRAPGLTQG